MARKSRKQLEASLTAQKKLAALLLVEKDLSDNTEEKSHAQIAEEVGATRNTIYKWRTQDRDFMAYINLLADDFLLAHQTTVYKQHMKLISATQPSTKAIELWYRKHGMLTDKTVVEDHTANKEDSPEDIAKEAEEIAKQLLDEEAE